jgi:acetolactate synthase-1/2/3 large subunit
VQLAGLKHLVLIDAKAPVSFFAYPGKKSYLVPDGCEVHELGGPSDDVVGSLTALVDALDAGHAQPRLQAAARPQPPQGPLTADTVCQAIAAVLPEGAIVSDESQTSGVSFPTISAGAPRHDVLALTGGAIGQGLPVAIGAAIASPDRPVFALEADGSAMYTIQSLWTMAREQLDITVVILNNRSYAILNIELERVGAQSTGARAKSQLDLAGPDLDFVALGNAMGVPSTRAESSEDLVAALRRAVAEPGPHLIEAVIPSVYSGFKLRAMPYALRALGSVPRPVAKAIKRRVYP